MWPSEMNYTFKVGVWTGGPSPDKEWDLGKLVLLSPKEPLDALFLRIAQAISDGESMEELQKWPHVVLSASGELVKIEKKAALKWERIKQRETFG